MMRARPSLGLTLLELMVTLAIAAILSTLAAPSFQDFFIRNSAAAIANEFTGSVLRARSTAAQRNMCVVMCRSTTTEAAVPQCARVAGNWNTGWMIFLNEACDAINGTPAIGQIVGVVNATRQEFSLVSNNTAPLDYIVFSPTGYPRRTDIGGYDLLYRTDTTRSSNRRICVNALGEVVTVAYSGACP